MRNSPVMAGNMRNSPVMTPNMRNSPVMAGNMRNSPVVTPNMRNSLVIKDDRYMSHIGHRSLDNVNVAVKINCNRFKNIIICKLADVLEY